MANYEVTIQVSVPDVEADSEDAAIKFVKSEIASVFAEPVRFYSESAIDYDAD